MGFHHICCIAFLSLVSSVTSTAIATTESTTVSTAGQPTPTEYSVYDSAIYSCSYYLFKDDLVSNIFPPADGSLMMINENVTLAEALQKLSNTRLCAEVDVYTRCVQHTVSNYANAIDKYLQKYITLNKYDIALKNFCENQDLIMSQFTCTKQRAQSHKCPYGGMYGLAKYAFVAITENKDHARFCKVIEKSIGCRVDTQLKKCDNLYGDVMHAFYTSFLSC